MKLFKTTEGFINLEQEGRSFELTVSRIEDKISEMKEVRGLDEDDELVGFIPVAKQRKISTVLFTTSNDENTSDNTFIGGELLFNFLYDVNGNEIKIKPKAGSMLVFLSNPYFTHEVLKVIEGRRITLVQWHNAIIN